MRRTNSSMQLTRAADYAVRVMIHLASLSDEKRISLPELARAAQAPPSFLSKVLQTLARQGLISSRRGTTGGFALLENGRKANMRTVIEAIEGPIFLNRCIEVGRSCGRDSWCPAHPVWAEAQMALLTVLERYTMVELAGMSCAVQTVQAPLRPVAMAHPLTVYLGS
jgi:Rrf2 family protein